MRQETSRKLFRYWNEVRGSRPAARRLDIEPARITSILPVCFILERAGPGSYRFRLAGTRLCEGFGAELRGRSFLDLWQPDDRAALAPHLDLVCEQAAVAVVEFEVAGGRSPVPFEAVFAPVVQTGPAIDRLLGAMSVADELEWPAAGHLARPALLRCELIRPGRPADGPAAVRRATPRVPRPASGGRLVEIAHRRFRVYEGGLARARAGGGTRGP